MLKQELRLNYTLLRKALSDEQIDAGSLAIAQTLLQLPIWHLEYFHLFIPITDKREIDTSYILTVLQGKDKNIVFPKVHNKTDLINYLLTDSTVFLKNKWNIPEPVDGIEVPSSKIDVVFVPLLAFDLNGNRVGYGKGFYDNFLGQCKSDVIKIGLSLFEPVVAITDTREEDIALDYCVTPDKIYSF